MAYAILTAPYFLKRVEALKTFDRLGHTDSKTTLDIYTHITQKAKAETIEKFENYLKNQRNF